MTEMRLLVVMVMMMGRTATSQINPYANCCEQYCYTDDDDPYIYLGTKTSYEFIYDKLNNQHQVPYCSPVQFWSFNRYGTHLPDRMAIESLEKLQKIKEEVIKNYEKRASYPDTGKLCNDDLNALRRWNWNSSININSALHLADQGKDDVRFLARRYQKKYPSLLLSTYREDDFKFQYANTPTGRSTYEAYIEGLFSTDAYRVHADIIHNDTLLSAPESCAAWKRDVEGSPETQSEVSRFKQREEYRRLVAHVSRRLGFRYTLEDDTIQNIYDMCRLEKSWHLSRISPWCVAFTKDQLKLLEYAEDLRSYYETGHGTPENKKLGCMLAKDMMNRFENVIKGTAGQRDPKAVVYFSDSSSFQRLLVALGINKDHRLLTSDNMRQAIQRSWRTSVMDPFSANLAAILYRCEQGERHRVMFFLNEANVDYPDCSVGLCDWGYLRTKLAETVDSCDLNFCDHAGALQQIAPVSVGALVAAVLVTLLRD